MRTRLLTYPSTKKPQINNGVKENSTNAVRGAARRKNTPLRRELKWLKEVRNMQKSTKLLIPRTPFTRLVREISLQINPDIMRYTETALEGLQEATEAFISQLLQDAYLLTLHRKCVTLSKSDMMVLRALKINM